MLAAKCKLFSSFSVTADCSALPLLSSIGAATRLFSTLSIKKRRRSHRFSVMLRASNSRSICITTRSDGMPVISTRHPSPLHELIRFSVPTCSRISSRTLFTFTFTLVFQFFNSVLQACPTVIEGFSHILIILRLNTYSMIELDFLHRLIFLEMPCSHFLR